MKLPSLLFILIAISNIVIAQTIKDKTFETNVKNIELKIDPNLELFHIMAFLSNSKNLNYLEFQYKNEAKEYFSKYKDDAEIKFVDKVLQNYHAQFLIDAIFINPGFKNDSSVINFLDAKEFGMANTFANKAILIDSLLKTINSFALRSNYGNFINIHKNYFGQKLDEVSESISGIDLVEYNEAFWGIQKDNYSIVICLFEQDIHSYWFTNNGKQNCVFILSPKFTVNSDAVFGNAPESNLAEAKISAIDYLFYGAGHEFGHCFFNPIADNYKSDIDKINFKIMDGLDKDKVSFLCESFLRSLTAYYMILNKKDEFAQMVLQMEKQQGFIYNDLILDMIKDYSNNRIRYKTFNDYMPELLQKLKQSIK